MAKTKFMRINWGVRIIIMYSSFVVFMLFMVYKCTMQHYDLVSGDYYAQELKYQDVIDGKNNLVALNEKVVIQNNGDVYDITLPAAAGKITGGEVFFYKPNSAAGDFRVPVVSGNVQVAKTKMAHGMYKVKITWNAGGKEYYDEQPLMVK
jgi:nitrogen fixation protein FixH